jgi:LPXTG-motif cell wall-anchored protein
MSGWLLAAAVVWGMAVAPQAQTSTSQETKAFTVLAVNGNQLIVRLPEGTRELMVPEDFLFTINGKQMNVRQLKAGMQGTATITTRTTVTPVSVTEVKNGTVVVRNSAGIIVRTDEGVRSFTQSDVDKRGVQVYRDGAPVQVAQLREGDRLSATIVTSLPPRVMTEQEVNATLATAKAASGSAAPAAAPAARPAAAGTSSAGATPPAGTAASAGTAARAPSASAAPSSASGGAARTLPSTASSWPLLGLAGALFLAIGAGLTMRRRHSS